MCAIHHAFGAEGRRSRSRASAEHGGGGVQSPERQPDRTSSPNQAGPAPGVAGSRAVQRRPDLAFTVAWTAAVDATAAAAGATIPVVPVRSPWERPIAAAWRVHRSPWGGAPPRWAWSGRSTPCRPRTDVARDRRDPGTTRARRSRLACCPPAGAPRCTAPGPRRSPESRRLSGATCQERDLIPELVDGPLAEYVQRCGEGQESEWRDDSAGQHGPRSPPRRRGHDNSDQGCDQSHEPRRLGTTVRHAGVVPPEARHPDHPQQPQQIHACHALTTSAPDQHHHAAHQQRQR